MTMTKNDILRRLRYTFDFDDSQMMAIFGEGGLEVTRAQISDWLKRDEDPACVELSHQELAIFLNGLINNKRGKKEGPQPVAEKYLTNNIIFRKIKIACDLQAEQILEILSQTGISISKHELSAFFRKTDHKHYRPCHDQVLRKFLMGLQLKYRNQVDPNAAPEPHE
jgi:uncharacterized protein YehS (DUF1456 family)